MRGSRKFCRNFKRAIIVTPAKHPNIECWLGSFVIFWGSGQVLLSIETLVIFVILRGVWTPCPSPSGSAHVLSAGLAKIRARIQEGTGVRTPWKITI